MSKALTYFLLILSTLIITSNSVFAQIESLDSIGIVEPPQLDSIYLDDDYYEDSITTNNSNSFDKIDTVAITSISWRKMDSNFINGIKNAPDFNYVKTGLIQPKQRTSEEPIFNINLSNIWLYIVIALFIFILVWYLRDNDLLLFRKKAAVIKNQDFEEEEKDIFSIHFADAIKEALKSNNYRLAIRLQYLQLLKMLSDKGLIKYQPDKTNFDYLLQTKSTAYYKEFLNATRNYEYSWYGLFPIDAERYEHIENAFSNLYKNINAK